MIFLYPQQYFQICNDNRDNHNDIIQMKRIAIFASGSGTNAEEIFKYFKDRDDVSVKVLLSNNPNAYALTRAKNHGVNTQVFDRRSFYQSREIVRTLTEQDIDLVVLAGFLWLIPENLLKAFPDRIINIHPALLPKYGGKGMYGMKVHESVIRDGEKESGITIHKVNAQYDEGEIIFQTRCEVKPDDTPDSLAQRIHGLEYAHFPKVIDDCLKNLN